MKVKALPAEANASGKYRIVWPARALPADKRVEVVMPNPPLRRLHASVNAAGKVFAVRHPECDVLVLQCPMTRALVESVPLYQELGVRVVVEVDDDYTALASTNAAFRAHHPRNNPDINWTWLSRCCRVADQVVVTTPALGERYGSRGNAVVVPNFVPASYLGISALPNERLTLGWAGVMDVHTGDLRATGGAVGRVVAETGAVVRHVGPEDQGEAIAKELRLAEPPQATGYLPIDQYAAQVATLDVGIVPLADTQFNQAKSWLKGLEMAACGVPFVASATRPYCALAKLGIGLVAAKPKDWYRQLRRLLTEPALREDLAAAGRQAAKELTIEGNAERFWHAWTGA